VGIGDWPHSPITNPQSPIPNPQSPLETLKLIILKIKLINKYKGNNKYYYITF